MRFILAQVIGKNDERKRALMPNKKYVVGRSTASDWPCADDRKMSSQHFRLAVDARTCAVEDLGSTNGTQVNGKTIKGLVPLRNGDEITAGNSVFRFRIESTSHGDLPAEIPAESPAPQPAATPAPAAAKPARKTAPISARRVMFRQEKCESGLSLFAGDPSDEGTSAIGFVAARLAEQSPLYWIVDRTRLGNPDFAGLEFASPLFTWLPPEAAQSSPVIIPPGVVGDQAALLESGWDQDAIVGCFSDASPEVVINHLQNAVRFNADARSAGPNDPQGVLGICWPSVLSQLLHFRSADFVGRLLHGIRGVLVETPDLPGSWQVYAPEEFGRVLETAGFVGHS